MNEKTITKAEYDRAVKEVMTHEINDPNLQGASKFLIPMVGMIFAQKIADRLFGTESKEEKDNG